ncbi:hypothetical protein BWK63_05185 [Flavobacterium covae]|uniref:Uncharacterized protein n=1 Tax=Flavobacterium covae TaxID=2906076 RepID=A0ABW8PDP6_9FLAO|nr:MULTISPECIES: hypothetical protein [Flavobacterium]OWP81576.1 hypothetical protein BWK63_05185 [Flavobacterium covae]POR22976.1 hypothetical protein BWK57_04100 [Flavobacterium columnare]
MIPFNYNLIGYTSFLIIIIFIIAVVGKICYKNGNVYVNELIPNHADLCVQINKTLLVGYYLVNIGYSAMTLIWWNEIITIQQLIETLALKIATIAFILSCLHYSNLYILTDYVQKLIK